MRIQNTPKSPLPTQKHSPSARRRSTQQGFTLIEIMIVLAIVGLLFSFVGVNLMNNFKKSKEQAAKIQIASFEQALQSFYVSHSFYPHTSQGLNALIAQPTTGRIPKNYPTGGHLSKKTLPKNPWGNDYRYECEDYQSYIVISDGPDGQPGTEDDVASDAS